MGIGPLVNLAGGYLQSILFGSSNGAASTNTTSAVAAPNMNGLSPFAQILGSLQQLQQSNPAQYQSVTQQISTNLQTGALSASANGNTFLAGQLNQLSTDFTNASTSGQLPNVPDLAHALVGAGGLPVHSRTLPVAGSHTLIVPSQAAANAVSIIDNTLSNAGIPIG